MKPARSLLLLAIVLVAMVVWFFLHDEDPSATEAGEPDAPVAKAAPHAPSLTELPGTGPSARDAVTTETSQVSMPRAKPETETWTVHGSVTVLDADGREHDREAGTLHATDCMGTPNGASQGYTRDIPVRAGAFEYELVEGRFLRINRADLGGRPAVVLEPAHPDVIQTVTSDLVEVLATWKPRIVLRVIGFDTRQPLSDLTVVDALWGGFERHGPEPPRGAQGSLRIDHAISPLEIPISDEDFLERRSRAYFVVAPGYAWGNVRFESWVGGVETIELRPAGGLDVEIVGASAETPGLELVATLEPPGAVGCAYKRAIKRNGLIQIDALLPGTYAVEARLGPSLGEEPCLARASVEVVANQRTSVSLLLEPSPGLDPALRVTVSGRLIVPREWKWSMPTLALFPRSGPGSNSHIGCKSMTRVDEAEGVFDWTFSDVQPGDYGLRLVEIGYEESLAVGPEGVAGFRFELPPPADVLVRVFDEGFGTDVEVRHFGWQAGPGPGDLVLFDADARAYRFRAPVGTIDVTASDTCHAHELGSHRFAVVPGTNEFTIELELPTGVRLVLRDGRRELDSPWETSIEGMDGGKCTYISGRGKEKFLYVDRPGRYQVLIPTLEGFEPIPQQTVDVGLGQMTDVLVDLVRKP